MARKTVKKKYNPKDLRKFTPELKTVLLKMLRLGVPIKRAANYAGISHSTYYNWKERATDGNPELIELFDAIKKAEIEMMMFHLDKIRKAAKDSNWTAAAWMLERRFPEFQLKDKSERFIDGMSLREFMAMLPDDTVEEIKKMIFKHKTEKKGETV